MNQELLNNLRDIHLPSEPSWWPLALGWWFIIVLTLILIFVAVYFLNKKHKLAKTPTLDNKVTLPIQFYIDRFKTIENQHQQDQDDLTLIQSTSILLRKFCILHSADSARLTEQAWLQHLNDVFNTENFTQQYGDILIKSNYAAQAKIDSHQFIQFIYQCLHSYSGKQDHA